MEDARSQCQLGERYVIILLEKFSCSGGSFSHDLGCSGHKKERLRDEKEKWLE